MTAARRERIAEREEAIVAAAHALILERGFEATKMADIAARAELAEGTLYLYFRNKEALGAAVVARFYARLTQAAEEGARAIDGALARLQFLARHHLDSILADWPVIEIAARISHRDSAAYARSDLFQFNKAYTAVFDAVVREGVLTGELRAEPALSVLRDLFYGGLEYAARTLVLRGRHGETQAVAAGIVNLLGAGLAMQRQAGQAGPAGPEARLHAIADRMEALLSQGERG